MTSLADAYQGRVADDVGSRRLSLGAGLFVAGVLLTAVGVIVATTDVLSAVGVDRMAAWRRAGVLAGLGVPAVIAGVFTVLPSSRRIKAAATIGASVSVLGVALFWYAYPAHWAGYGKDLTLQVTAVYFFGMTTSVWCLFAGIATLKRRNDPGGTVSLKVSKGGETRIVEVDRSELRRKGVGGVGVFGSDPDGDVDTQTGPGIARENVHDAGGQGGTSGGGSPTAAAGGEGGSRGPAGGGDGQPPSTGSTESTASGATATSADAAGAGAATSDGGLQDDEITSLDADGEVISSSEAARDLADRYCGNCEYFRYVRSENGMEPFCGFHNRAMDDMEACEEWEPNT